MAGNSSSSLVTEFYRQQHNALLHYLQRKLGSLQEANDVAQQTYERLLSNANPHNINNPQAFIYKVANNIAIDHLRQRKARGENERDEFDGDELTSPGLAPEEHLDCELVVSLVRQFIAELPPKCRTAFLHYKFEERSYAEIADLLGVSESMVRKYVLRAIAYCRSRLDQSTAEPMHVTAQWDRRKS